MGSLLINRINLRFNKEIGCYLNISKSTAFSLVGGKLEWTKGKLPSQHLSSFDMWMKQQEAEDHDFICFDFSQEQSVGSLSIPLDPTSIQPFRSKIFVQELGRFLIEKGFYVEPLRVALDLCAYQRVEDFDQEFERYRRIDFKWNARAEELSFNVGSETTRISRQKKKPEAGVKIIDDINQLVYVPRDGDDTIRRVFARDQIDVPHKFDYQKRYHDLSKIASEYLYTFRSQFFDVDRSGLKSVNSRDVQTIFYRQNLMVFGGGKTAVNAALGMREHGPFKKIDEPNKVQLLFIYKNRDDANNLYQYLKNGLRHFPGLLSYIGIPVAVPDGDDRGLKYSSTTELPNDLKDFLTRRYPGQAYPETLAIVIGPFKKYESDDEESETYYQVKQLLLAKGISSQFVADSSIKDANFHFFLPNIAIAILAKLGGIPWKLDTKRYNELVVGFNTRKLEENTFLGSAVFFDNEGKLGLVQGFPGNGTQEIIRHLGDAILVYAKNFGEPDRLVIHYYKPSRREEIGRIESLLKEEMNLPIPFAVVEINDSKSKMDICFDVENRMGMPESGVYVKVGWDEYLLFNNNRYEKQPVRKVEEVLPIKVKISFADTGGFHHKELITQVYEFSRLNWKGLKQKSQPVTTTYSKMIADFSSRFGGAIPENRVSQSTPWFI